MDPLRIVIRVVFAYVVLLAFIRLSGKRGVKQANVFDFTVAIVLGDLVDDMLWAEVPASQFVVATGMLMIVHVAVDLVRFRTGAWR